MLLRGFSRSTAALVAVVAVTALLAGQVSAHAAYERSEPAKNAIVPAPPAQVDVYYTQDLARQQGAYFLRVFSEDGTQVSLGDGIIDDDNRRHMFATLSPGLSAGRYIVRWMNLSDEDGEADEGAFCFYVGVEPTAAQAAECAAFEEDGAVEPTAPATQPVASPTQLPPTEVAPTATAPEPTATDSGNEADDGGAPVGAIVGGIVGGVIAVAVIAGGVIMWLRRSTG